MWVLEGDEVVAVNGTNVEGKSLDEVGTDPIHKMAGQPGTGEPTPNGPPSGFHKGFSSRPY